MASCSRVGVLPFDGRCHSLHGAWHRFFSAPATFLKSGAILTSLDALLFSVGGKLFEVGALGASRRRDAFYAQRLPISGR